MDQRSAVWLMFDTKNFQSHLTHILPIRKFVSSFDEGLTGNPVTDYTTFLLDLFSFYQWGINNQRKSQVE